MAGNHPHTRSGPRGSSRTAIAARGRDVPAVAQRPPTVIGGRGGSAAVLGFKAATLSSFANPNPVYVAFVRSK